jgi:hypothetical protein
VHIDQFDVIAVIVGVMFIIRKLDTQSRKPEQQPHVPEDDFRTWQRQAASAYAPGAYASFFRVLFHVGFVRYQSQHPLALDTYARIGGLVDLLWIVCVITTLYRSYRSRELQRKLGITLEKPQPSR